MKKNLAIGDRVSISYSDLGEGIIVEDAGDLSMNNILFPGCDKLWRVQINDIVHMLNEYWLEKIPSKIKLFEDDV